MRFTGLGAVHWLAVFCSAVCTSIAFATEFSADGRRVMVRRGGSAVIVEAYSDKIVHVEVTTNAADHDVNKVLYTTPMVASPALKGATVVLRANGLSTVRLEATIQPESLCVRIYDKALRRDLVTSCPKDLDKPWKTITLQASGFEDVYGLGNYFRTWGTADGTWNGNVWDPTYLTHGNAMREFSGGMPSYAMFPIIYALGQGKTGFAFFLDQIYKQEWKFNTSPWSVGMWGDQMRWYVMTGDDVQELRKSYMGLTGLAPLPPKKALGLWVSEFGYTNWGEVDQVVGSLRHDGFPLDGLGMDIQWFGGNFYRDGADTRSSRMGTLQFDASNFPDFADKVRGLRENNGVALMTIEESYISAFLPEHEQLRNRGFMARNCLDQSPVFLKSNPWWGVGGMIDWTNPEAGKVWHDWKRQPLYDLGLTWHWTDLGEPEMYNADACYFGFPEIGKNRHGDIHNIYNFRWLESIARGYEDHRNRIRPYMMSRSGTSGIQRFGAGMWSGDVGANMVSMAAHYNVQMHMSMSGIDYFSSDVGGFHRRPDTLDGDPNELYTQWFANASLFDFPVRPHVWNLQKNLKTSPNAIGNLASNRFNIQQRYALAPYYYSLAYQASLDGSPVIPPLVYFFQDDMAVRSTGNQKMIGPFLMGAMVARYGESRREVYLPKGKWFNFHSHQAYSSQGEKIGDVPEYEERSKDVWIFRAPLFARAGAVIPMAYVDDRSMNVLGMRDGEAPNTDLHVRVYPDAAPSSFSLYEDDGETIDHRSGRFATTRLEQHLDGSMLRVAIRASEGHFPGFPESRNQIVRVILDGQSPTDVQINGSALARCSSMEQFDKSERCWTADAKVLSIKTGPLSTNSDKQLDIGLPRSGRGGA